MSHRRNLAAIAALIIVAITATTAFAVTPKPGRYYETRGDGIAVLVVQLYVDDSGTITSVSGTNPDCTGAGGLPQGFGLPKEIKVKRGKFAYHGKADNNIYGSGPRKLDLDLTGKFATSTKLMGSYKIADCPKLRFETTYQAQ